MEKEIPILDWNTVTVPDVCKFRLDYKKITRDVLPPPAGCLLCPL